VHDVGAIEKRNAGYLKRKHSPSPRLGAVEHGFPNVVPADVSDFQDDFDALQCIVGQGAAQGWSRRDGFQRCDPQGVCHIPGRIAARDSDTFEGMPSENLPQNAPSVDHSNRPLRSFTLGPLLYRLLINSGPAARSGQRRTVTVLQRSDDRTFARARAFNSSVSPWNRKKRPQALLAGNDVRCVLHRQRCFDLTV
jgi:hypothetical protein